MRANELFLDGNKGVDIGWKQMGGFWMKIMAWVLDESKGVVFGWK
jgi:hypothetical protein